MSFLGRLLQFLFWFMVVSWAIKLLARAIGGTKTPRTTPSRSEQNLATSGKRLVKDPVCGMHMAEELALTLNANGKVLYFCSEQCRAKYDGSMVRQKASA